MLGLLAWLLVSFSAAAVGGPATSESAAFYRQLELPGWAPPAAWFAPVWTVLYLLIGISAWLVWRERGLRGARGALSLFAVQLALNALWTWLFFAWQLGAAAFVEIVVLSFLIILSIGAFWRLGRRLAALLLLPYLVWVAFAAALTYSVWTMNPLVLG